MRISPKHIPLDIHACYNMAQFVHDDHVLMQINQKFYGLPQAGKLSQDHLVTQLASHGYHQCTNTPCLFVLNTNDIALTLGVKKFPIEDKTAADHLLTILQELYEITTEFSNVHLRFKRTILHGADSPIIYVLPQYEKFQHDVHHEKTYLPFTPLTT